MTKVVKPYGEETQSKKQEVATMFNNISGRYDFLNHLATYTIPCSFKALRFAI